MAGKNPDLTSLSDYKKLLVAESDLNREILAAEISQIKSDVQDYFSRAKSTGSILSTVMLLFTTLNGLRSSDSEKKAPKTLSWFGRIAAVATGARTLWSALRPGRK